SDPVIHVVPAVFRVAQEHASAFTAHVHIAAVEGKTRYGNGRVVRSVSGAARVKLLERGLVDIRWSQRSDVLNPCGPAIVGDAFPRRSLQGRTAAPHGVGFDSLQSKLAQLRSIDHWPFD